MTVNARPDWTQVRALFEQALPLAPAARQALLQQAQPALAAEVGSLLLQDLGSTQTGFLSGHAADAGHVGERMGPWRITGRLGSGGMGEVWLAERDDGAYRGEAALKLLKRGMDSAAVLARFAQEQQALARLAHPHIARLVDAGRTADGHPYFAMERVSGKPIDQACEGLDLRARIALFLQLAEAVAHAHRNLLVHRDLKPSNVLVSAEGQVKLLDFGIAKALQSEDSPDATLLGPRPFTPHYASPEQVRGEPLTTATDVYSLGVLLYLMLTGQRPYGVGANTAEHAARCVLDEEPARPSSVSQPGLFKGDLDKLLLKALEKDISRRYASVDALAADLRAYLGGYPLAARAPSAGYLLAKFAARNRLAVGLSALALVSLVGGFAATAWQMHQTDQARQAAERRFAQVRQMANQLVFRYHDQIHNLPGAVAVRQALLDDASKYLDGLAEETAGDPSLARELAETYQRLSVLQGEIFSPGQERVKTALINAEKATSLQAQYAAATTTAPEVLNAAVDMWLNRATIEARLGRVARSLQSLQQAALLAQRVRALAPDDLQVISRQATLEGRLGLSLGSNVSQANLGRVADAKPHWDEALRLFQQLVDREPNKPEWVHQLAWGWVGRMNWALLAGDYSMAVQAGEQAVALRDRAAQMSPGNAHFFHQRAAARNNLAVALVLHGDHERALKLHAECAEILETSLAADPSNKTAVRDRTLMALSSARALSAVGKRAEALAAVRDSLAKMPVGAFEPDDFYMTRWRAEGLVWLARLTDKPVAAADAAREAVALVAALPGDQHAARQWALAQAQGEWAQALLAGGDRASAAMAAAEAVRQWGHDVPGFYRPLLERDRKLALGSDAAAKARSP